MPGRKGPAVLRFAAKIRQQGDCWIWTGSVVRGGYGQFRDEASRMVKAHRWSYEHHIGPVPEGLQLDHLCRTTRCVNPWHLDPVTARENLVRAEGTWAGRNVRKNACPRGHAYPPHEPGGVRYCLACRREKRAA